MRVSAGPTTRGASPPNLAPPWSGPNASDLGARLRIATHPRLFSDPLSPADAMRNLEALMALTHCRIVGEPDGFWTAYADVTHGVRTRGNLVPDAHLVAVLQQNGIGTVYTHDRDFRKFACLDVRDPLAE